VQANYFLWKIVKAKKIQHYTPGWKECVRRVSADYQDAVSAMFIKEHFSNTSKILVEGMASSIIEEFEKIINGTEWLDEQTKEGARNKISALHKTVAYPPEILDDDRLDNLYKMRHQKPKNYMENQLMFETFQHVNSMVNQRRQIVSNDGETGASLTYADVNAWATPWENKITIPAAILGGAFYGSHKPHYLNYGGIGAVIGHEIVHGYDDQGSQYDYKGNLVNWWEPESKSKYREKVQCLIDQYTNFEVKVGDETLNVNGINTQGENIADVGGIKAAYRAYNHLVSNNGPEPTLPGLKYTPRQLFWLSFGRTWCNKVDPRSLKDQLITGVHSPGEFRVKGTLQNMPEFARDWNCPIGSPMNPVKKCSVW